MDWNSYRKVCKNFEFSICQTMVMTLLSKEVLKEWPNSLPENIKEPLTSARKKASELWGSYFDKKITSEQMNAEWDRMFKEWEQVEGRRALLGTVLRMHWSRPDTSSNELDFSRIVCAQALVMLFAHLDAFMADSMRAICRVRPETLKCNKTMEWADIVSAGAWDRLIDQLVEEYVFTFGWQTTIKRIEFLRNKIGLTFDVAAADLKLLEDS